MNPEVHHWKEPQFTIMHSDACGNLNTFTNTSLTSHSGSWDCTDLLFQGTSISELKSVVFMDKRQSAINVILYVRYGYGVSFPA